MTREEFTERVGLNVSDGIFEVWNGVYMSSDKDKDEFCKPFATKKGHLDLSRSMVIEIAELKKKIRVQKESYARQVELATSYQDKYYAEKSKHDEFYLNSATHIVRNKFKILSNNILTSILPCQKIHLT